MENTKKYILEQIIGEGATSTVYRAVSSEGKEVAIKVIPKTEKSARMTCKEVNVLSGIKHENIVEIFDKFESGKNIYVVEELCDFNLISFLKEYDVDEVVALKILRMILCAMMYLHSLGIIHRDIKLGNVLLKGNIAKVCDFGLSCYFYECCGTFCGTADYIAPEIVERKRYTTAADMWSVGIVFYVLLTKKKFVVGRELLCCSSESSDLLGKLLEIDPDQRITASEALNHQCFDRFLPVCKDYRCIPDFEKATRFGVVKKVGMNVQLGGIRVTAEGFGASINDENRQKDVNKAEHNEFSKITGTISTHRNFSCMCHKRFSYTVFVHDRATTPHFLTNMELKVLSLMVAYVKMFRERTSKIVIEEEDCKFYYMFSNDFVYETELFMVKKKNDTHEVFWKGERSKPTGCDVIPNLVLKRIFELYERCKEIDAGTCWFSERSPILMNCSSHLQFSISHISQGSEIDLKGRVLHKYIESVGWCVKSGQNCMFLLSNGVRFDVLCKDMVLIYLDTRFRIDHLLSKELKYNLKKVVPLLRMFL